MSSALAFQLAKNVSLNAPLLSETARKKHFASSSYLFSASTKGQIDDLDTIHALALNALSQLRQVYPSIAAFDEVSLVHRTLFSHRARETDRTLLGKDDLAELNASIKNCLAALGSCLLENATGRILEWLVRRFRINEFNVRDVLTLFLPYHESPHFAKMVSILTIEESLPWGFLSAYKATGKSVQRSTLAIEMVKNRELARFVISLLPETLAAAGGRNAHRTLVCFNTSIVLEYITRAERRNLDTPTLAFLLPALTEPLKVSELSVPQALRKDTILGSFLLLAALSQKCTFTMPAVKAIVSGMVHCASATSLVGGYQLLTALISFLGPQQQLDDISPSIADEIIALPDFNDALRASLGWSGIEKLVVPILGRLVEKSSDVKSASATELLITSNHSHPIVLEHLSKKLLLKSDTSELLSELYQRHPEVVRSSAEKLTATNEDKGADIQQSLLTLAVPKGPGKALQDVILASSNADSSVRAGAVKRLAEVFVDNPEGNDADEKATMRQALLARLYDTDAIVLEALYKDSKVILPFLADALDILPNLAASLAEQKATRSVLRLHLTFFCNSFVTVFPKHNSRVALSLVFPNALFSKPRNKTAAAIWEVVGNSRLGEGNLFKGTKEIIGKGGEDLAEINDALTKRIAENFRVSNEYPELLTWLLENASDKGDSHTRLFCLLVLRALLSSLPGDYRIEAALKFVGTINVADLAGIDQLGDGEGTLGEESTLRNIVAKPSSRTTTQRLRFMILASISGIPRPNNRKLEWFSPDNPEMNDVVTRYSHLQRAVYSITNAIIPIPANHDLFRSLGSDSLLFLASVWTSSTSLPGIDQDTTRYIALRHASAFIQAQSIEHPVDFQVILPSLLASLQASDTRIRTAAMECIVSMAASTSGSKPSVIYAYDQVYGASSARLQYLDWSDEAKYLNLLVEYKDHMVNDPEYLVLFQHEHVTRSKAENKKEAKLRQRILCFLLSHALSCPSQAVRLSVLTSLSRVSDPVKLQMLLPIIEEAFTSPSFVVYDSQMVVYALQSFDSSAGKELNAEGSGAWAILTRAIERCLAGGEVTEQWTCLRTTIKEALFAVLSAKRQLEFSLKLIDLGSQVGDGTGIKHTLSHCVKKPALMVALLQSLQPDVKETSERTSKKARKEGPSPDSENAWLPRLYFLAELLSSIKLPGSPELISTLLDTLNRVVASSTSAQADIIYVEQLLMSCLESSVANIQELPSLAPSAIRADILVELMRISENPQTFNQALMLLASLAKLSPTSILHNVMPIFTFMGSNVFHRDDSYSFKVIQKTTESIVPVAIASLKERYEGNLDLYKGSRDLLRTFTDASTHIPRHRRTSFFTHLVDVMNPDDYLAPILMLLADKSANRVSRQEKQEAQTTLALPLSVLQHYPPTAQLTALTEIIREVQRLLPKIQDHSSEEKAFLEVPVFDEHAVSPSTLRKRQCQTLLILTGFAMKQMSPAKLAKSLGDDLDFTITSLMELTTLDHNEQISSDLREIGSSAQWALLQSMSVITAQFFSSAILSMLSSENGKIHQAAFGLLASRVPQIKPETREEISPVMAQIVNRMKELVSSSQDINTLSEAMKALLSIGESAYSKEESALTSMLNVVIDIIRKYPGISQAVAVVPAITTRLGPRIIPYLRSLIDTCVSLVRSSDPTLSYESLIGGIHALSSLLKTIPTFWGVQEIKLVVDLYLDEELAVTRNLSSQLEKLTRLLAKQIPGQIVLSSLMQSWPSIDNLKEHYGLARFGRFFELLKRCLHFAARPDVLENLRGLFNHLLNSFEARSILEPQKASSVEDKIISAYLELVVKLNETAFQPLFRRMVDWAFGDGSSSNKQITFCRHYSALLDLFKELMTPYMSLLTTHFSDLLTSFTNGENKNKELWLSVIETLSKSFIVDDGVYWRDTTIRLLTHALTQQIPTCITLKLPISGKTLLSNCLTSLIDCLEDDSSIKDVNHEVLMCTRSEDVRVRMFALECSLDMWTLKGGKLRAFGTETATFIIECAEDENDEIVRICRKLKDAVQAEVGKIEGL